MFKRAMFLRCESSCGLRTKLKIQIFKTSHLALRETLWRIIDKRKLTYWNSSSRLSLLEGQQSGELIHLFSHSTIAYYAHLSYHVQTRHPPRPRRLAHPFQLLPAHQLPNPAWLHRRRYLSCLRRLNSAPAQLRRRRPSDRFNHQQTRRPRLRRCHPLPLVRQHSRHLRLQGLLEIRPRSRR